MSLIRYGLNNKLPEIQAKPLVPKKVPTETSISSGAAETTGSSGASGVSGSSGSNIMPKELNELFAKYQEEGCTKAEILNVLDKLGIKANENENKIDFEYNGKQYSLIYTESTSAESRVASAPDVASDDDAAFVKEFDEFISGVNAEIDNMENEINGLMEFALANHLPVEFLEYDNKFMLLSMKMDAKKADIEKNPSKYTDEMKAAFEKCRERLTPPPIETLHNYEDVSLSTLMENCKEQIRYMLEDQMFVELSNLHTHLLGFDTESDFNVHVKQRTEEILAPKDIQLPNIQGMNIEEINETLVKYEATLNAVKGQIEILDKKGANLSGGGPAATQMLNQQRAKYQNVMMQLLVIIGAMQQQKAMLEELNKVIELEAQLSEVKTDFRIERDQNGNRVEIETKTFHDGSSEETKIVEDKNGEFVSSTVTYMDKNGKVTRIVDTVPMPNGGTRELERSFDDESHLVVNITYKDKDGNKTGGVTHKFPSLYVGDKYEREIHYNDDGTVAWIRDYKQSDTSYQNITYYYDENGNVTKALIGNSEKNAITGDLAAFINEFPNRSHITKEQATRLMSALRNSSYEVLSGNENSGFILFKIKGQYFTYNIDKD